MLQIWAGIMQLHKCEGGGREVHIVVFNKKHQSSFWKCCRDHLSFRTTVRGEVDLRFEESPLGGLKVTLGNVAKHMGHGAWHQERQGSAQAPELAQDCRYLTPLCQSKPWKVFWDVPVHEATSKASLLHGKLWATNIWAQLCMGHR